MAILVVGLSHRTAPVEVRERAAIPPEAVPGLLAGLREAGVREGVVVSTCNRTEVYAEAEDPSAAAAVARAIADTAKLGQEEIAPCLYFYHGMDGVRHAFRVAASLDSMVRGESQILGQVKAGFAQAQASGHVGPVLGRMFERAFAVAKRVRTETAIGENAASVGSAAADLARAIFGDLKGRSVLVIGAGKMGRLTLRHLRSAGVGSVHVANRTREKAEELLREVAGGFYVPLEELGAALERVDIALSAANLGRWALDGSEARALLRRRRGRPLFVVDIAVPRSVEPSANEVENLFLYDIDDLQGVVESSLAGRAGEAERAERMVEQEAEDYARSLREQDVVPAIRALLDRLETLRHAELERHLGSRVDLTGPAREAVEQATRALVGKIAHGPIQELKRAAATPGGGEIIAALVRALVAPEGRGGRR